MMFTRFFGLLAVFALLTFAGCDQTEDDRRDGTILGVDNALCACCGGYLIVIDGFTYRAFESDFPSTEILDNAAFPIEVRVAFEVEGTPCNNINQIRISTIERR